VDVRSEILNNITSRLTKTKTKNRKDNIHQSKLRMEKHSCNSQLIITTHTKNQNGFKRGKTGSHQNKPLKPNRRNERNSLKTFDNNHERLLQKPVIRSFGANVLDISKTQ